MSHFILSSQELKDKIAQFFISANTPIDDALIQPASLDLRFGKTAWRVAASFLPGGQKMSVEDKVSSLKMHDVDLTDGTVFLKKAVSISSLFKSNLTFQKILKDVLTQNLLPRLDVFARILTDGGDSFDNISSGFKGRLYAEIAPRTFSIRAHLSDRLTQLRLMQDMPEREQASKPHMMPLQSM